MSSEYIGTAVQPTGDPDERISTSGAEDNQPVSSPTSPPTSGDIPNPTIVEREWNGGPMDWESWPIGRPGPLVSEGRIQQAMGLLQKHDQERDESSRTEEKVIHVAEFSSTGQGGFDIYDRVGLN